MDFLSAFSLKQAVSSVYFRTLQTARRMISFNPSVPASGFSLQKNLLPQVNGVGIGQKVNGESFVKVLTRGNAAVSPLKLSRYYGVATKDIVLEEKGRIRFCSLKGCCRPPYPGLSMAHYRVTAGTLGCFVQDKKNRIYILSNNHVIANSNKAKFHDPVIQPGLTDGGTRKKDPIAKLSYLVELNRSGENWMDAAIAEVLDDINPVFLLANKIAVKGVAGTSIGLKVEKIGRTTGHTKGRITTSYLDIQVDFDGRPVEFRDQFEVKGNRGAMFCDAGDSGALIFGKDTHDAVGLLFAGTADGTSFASPIGEVLNAFSVKIL